MRNALIILACLIGEGAIIGAFLLFGRPLLPDNVLVLDIVVTTIVYGLFVVDLFVPWLDLGDKAQRKVGSLGLRWTVNWLYAVLALGFLALAAAQEYKFSTQLFVQIAILGLLALGYSGVLGMNDKVADVYAREEAMRETLGQLKSAVSELLLEHDIHNPAVLERIEAVKNDIRFISPSNNAETHAMEHRITGLVSSLALAIESGDNEQTTALLSKIEKLVAERKRCY